MLDFELELPFILLALGLLLSIGFWVAGIFINRLQGRRWRLTVAPFAFAFMGLLGLFATVRFKMEYLNDWMVNSLTISPHFELVTLAIFLFGYLFFGTLGCWLAIRVVYPFDRTQTLKTLYITLQNQKKQD
jgi:hypothetical protein